MLVCGFLTIVYPYSVSILAQVVDLSVVIHPLCCQIACGTMAPLNGAAQGLFGVNTYNGDKRKADGEAEGAPAEKRQSLRRYEHFAPQVLFADGVSPVHECTNQQLWKFASTGNKGVLFFSEFCSKESYRQGIAGSRHAETMLIFCGVLDEAVMEKLLDKGILEKVRAEYAKYKPYLETLNGGKTSGGNSKSFMTMCKKDIKKEKAPVEEAAAMVHDWLSNDNSVMLGFLQIMSWGGIFYSAMCSDKVARCAMDPTCGSITKDAYKAMMVARLCSSDGAVADDSRNSMSSSSARLFGA